MPTEDAPTPATLPPDASVTFHSHELPPEDGQPNPTTGPIIVQPQPAKEPVSPNVPPSEEIPGEDLFKPEKHNLLMLTKGRFIVYLDEENNLIWATSDAFDAELEAKIKTFDNGEQIAAEVYDKATLLSKYPTDYLTNSIESSYMAMVGEGLVRLFDMKNPIHALRMLTKAEEFLSARKQETARGWYLQGSSYFAGLILIVLFFVWWCRTWWKMEMGDTVFWALIGMGVGSVGAWLSVLQRVGGIPLDPTAGEWLHYVEGTARIAVGMISAGIVAVAVKGGLIGITIDGGTQGRYYLLVILSAVAGASERFVRSFIDRVEVQVSADWQSRTKPKGET